MLRAILRLLFGWIPFVSKLFSDAPTKEPNKDLPPARVAIIGAGIGGCFSANFLRNLGGKELDIHVWNKKESKVGGRTTTIQIGDHWYEAGASVAHISNQYLMGAVKEHGLTIKKDDGTTVPLGIYDGTKFVFRTGTSSILNMLKTFWHYGFTLLRMQFSTSSLLKKYKRIYTLQEQGESYATVTDLLEGMDKGGDSVANLTKVTAREHYTQLGWSQRVIDELITAAMRVNYGQSCEVNAFCTYVSLAGMEDSSLWCVVGGNWQIAEKVLEASGATLHKDSVTTVTRIDKGGELKYKLTTASGEDTGEFDVVIVANPLNVSNVKFDDFPTSIYTAAASTPYQRTVAEFVKGRINREFFHRPQSERTFPLTILTTELTGAPFDFRSVSVDTPSELPQEETKEYMKLYQDEPVRVWKLFTPQPLTEDQKEQMFLEIEDEVTVDWLAYPHYNPPEQYPSFILDDGMFYVNAIEKAASAMEMSAIGAKNAALLARDYLAKKSES